MAVVPSLVVGRTGPHAHAATADVALVDGVQPVRIDWAKKTALVGEPIEPLTAGVAQSVRLEVWDRYVCLRGRDGDPPRYHEPLLAVWDSESLSLVDVPQMMMTWCISGDLLYGFPRHRLRCVDLREGRERWRTRTLLDSCRVIVPTDDYLIVLTQDERFAEAARIDIRNVSHVRIFDAHVRKQHKDIALPKRWVHVLSHQPGRLLLWDCTFLYNVTVPGNGVSQGDRELVIRRADADPDAIASLKLASDLENPPRVEVPQLPAAPTIDGDLSDWPVQYGQRLQDLMDWKPDFAHRSRWKTRAYGGKQDIAAVVRAGQTADAVYLSAEVTDDVHFASPAPGLWRSDSMTLLFVSAKSDEADPTMLTAALVNGAPQFELGTAVAAIAASPQPDREPISLPGARTFILPPLRQTGAAGIAPGVSIDVLVCRIRPSNRTVYELRVPKTLFPYGPDTRWDVIINENDGLGREGGLQIGSAGWGIEETAIGSIRGQ